MLRVLIAPDKFKGTLCAADAARAIAKGWHQARPKDALELMPITDGGDGFGRVMASLLTARPRKILTIDAAHRPCKSTWWFEPKTKTAILESARVVGLAMLPSQKFHPFKLDTFGLGAVVCAARRAGARHCLVGIGGSATNDGGFGLARSLGWQFVDSKNRSIERWTDLSRLARILPAKRRKWFNSIRVAVDVQNPLLGAKGATRIYGPQKGLHPSDFSRAESCLKRLARVCATQFECQFAKANGAGAAGGLGFGLMTFLNARLEPGFDALARLASIDKRLATADLVITGEGAIDATTFMGKATGQLAQRCRKLVIPCLALAGVMHETAQTRTNFFQSRALSELTSVRQAQSKAAFWLQRLACLVATDFEPKGLQSRKAELRSEP
jgi:glycerate kinase